MFFFLTVVQAIVAAALVGVILMQPLAALAVETTQGASLETTLDRNVTPIEQQDPLGGTPVTGGEAAPAPNQATPANDDPLAQ